MNSIKKLFYSFLSWENSMPNNNHEEKEYYADLYPSADINISSGLAEKVMQLETRFTSPFGY